MFEQLRRDHTEGRRALLKFRGTVQPVREWDPATAVMYVDGHDQLGLIGALVTDPDGDQLVRICGGIAQPDGTWRIEVTR